MAFEKGRTPWNKGLKGAQEAWNKGKKHLAGDKNPNWKGGISTVRNRIFSSTFYRQWRSDVFTRDDFTCQKCSKRGGELNAHHKKSFKDILKDNDIKSLKEAEECSELWNINNGITFCRECHEEFHDLYSWYDNKEEDVSNFI